MYIKVIGAAAAMAAFLMAGNQYYMSGKNAHEAITACRFMLSLIRSELSTSSSELSCILEHISDRLSGPARNFALCVSGEMDKLGSISFQNIWSCALEEFFLHLGENEKNTMTELGNILGRYELEQQLNAIDYAVISLTESEKNSLEQLKPRAKLSFGLSGAMGLMLIIVLI